VCEVNHLDIDHSSFAVVVVAVVQEQDGRRPEDEVVLYLNPPDNFICTMNTTSAFLSSCLIAIR
jgi:hypothetical protein